MHRHKKKYDASSIPLSQVQYTVGAKSYQGGEEVFLALLAMVFARSVIDKVPEKKLTPHISVLYKRWGDLISLNADWMKSMEEVNDL